jgi:hypothetical protein
MLEALTIIVALGGLEIMLWWADHKRQQEQLETLEAIWVELALLNEGRAIEQTGQIHETPGSVPAPRLPSVAMCQPRAPVTQ